MTEAPPESATPQDKLPVFISWSRPLAEVVAKTLRQWLVGVVPGIEPWFSGEDIETGKFWQSELHKSLDRSTVGIVVVTPANSNRPWVNYEAGRLASTIESRGGVVMPLLLNMSQADITGTPLSTLNVVTFNEDGIWKIVKAIHDRTAVDMAESMLHDLFKLRWNELRMEVKAAIDDAVATDSANASPEKRDTAVVLEDLVSSISELRRDMQRINGVAQWPQINEADVYDEVVRVLARAGVPTRSVQIVDVGPNGKIFLRVVFDPSETRATMREVREALTGVQSIPLDLSYPSQ